MAYTIGIILSFAVYLVVGMYVGRKVKTADDYYVAGRNAPTLLIVGSLIASYTGTGLFMGDAGEFYSGGFFIVLVAAILQVVGYIYGAVFFGRYLRRSKALTVPAFFRERFNSRRMQRLAGITTIVAVCAYLLSVMQGVSTLMSEVTGLDYQLCVVISWLSFMIFTVFAGSRGVLIADTLMFSLFTSCTIVAVLWFSGAAGGWTQAVQEVAARPEGLFAWSGGPNYLYGEGVQNIMWALIYGVMWMFVVMVSPWQTSRYLMAKNEHVVVRSAVYAAIGVCLLEVLVAFAALFVSAINPDIADPTRSLIWAATNLLPLGLGVFLLTGILAAGISSASTFLSLLGFSAVNDVAELKDDGSRKVRLTRLAMIVAGLVVLALAYTNPPGIFVVMYFGSSVLACCWGPVAIASIWSKRVSEAGVFWGMLSGFVTCFVVRLSTALAGITLPIYFDSFVWGLIVTIVVMFAVSAKVKPTADEKSALAELHQTPAEVLSIKELVRDRNTAYILVGFGVAFVVLMVFGYVLPYLTGAGVI